MMMFKVPNNFILTQETGKKLSKSQILFNEDKERNIKDNNELIYINISLNYINVSHPTIKDYFNLTADELILYDKRSLLDYFTIQILNKHTLFFTFWLLSLINPFHVRLLMFFTKLGLFFSINALAYTDLSIDMYFNHSKEVKKLYFRWVMEEISLQEVLFP